MEKYNLDFNKIIDKKSIKNYLENYQRDINTINLFGIAKAKETLDRKSIGVIDVTYIGETAIFVPMDYYCVINHEENAFTFGIGSCCGLVILNRNAKFLMHISPRHSTDEVLTLLKVLHLSDNGEVYIFPGNACEFGKSGNQVNYKQLANKLELLNNKVYVRKFSSMSGGVYLLNDKLIIWDEEPYYIKNFENSNSLKK